MINALDEMEFIELGPIDDDKKPKSQRQMKMRRRAATQSRVIDTELFKLFDIDVPESRAEAEGAKTLILTQQRSILQRYLEALRSETLVDAIMESCVTKQEVHVTPVPTMQPAIAGESIDAAESSNAMVYPKVQPMKSALYFDNPEGFGDWFIFIGPAADSELRRRHKKERTTFDIIVKKMKELSNGHFSPDNHKRLGKSGAKSAVYEAKMTSDLRLVYQIDLVPSNDERLRQAIKIFGIFTHAQMENNRVWESIDHQLGRKNKQYREYCAIRQRVASSDNHTFTPAYFPPLPEGLEDMQVSNLLANDADQLQSRFLMEKYVQFSQPLMNTMLANLDAVFPHLVSPQEKLIIEHPNSCYVIGRSGTGKTTTLLFKMLLVERTYKLAEPGTPRPRQIFVTQSPILAKKVSQYFAMLDQSLVAADGDHDRLAELSNASAAADDDLNMISAEDVEDWWNHLPQQFSQLEDGHFPLFLTWNKLSMMLEADMALQQQKTKGTTNERASVHTTQFRSNDLVDFRKFVQHYWPAISQSLAKKTGVIKGSEAALSKETRFLDSAAYESMCNRRPVFFASDTDRFYSVFQAYINRKKQSEVIRT
ncbi:hypothetical protein VNI00_009986 [Paramarasmius palmivorus]|uniref:AAA+ ATPase domain-containing protein n=1 Tax=Paramarasmius palmivorus TaxID=297713 RepID=A0AAW0CN83_9AGAR